MLVIRKQMLHNFVTSITFSWLVMKQLNNTSHSRSSWRNYARHFSASSCNEYSYEKNCFNNGLKITFFPLNRQNNGHNGLPFAAWYPFDISNSLYYEIVRFHQIISVLFTASVSVYSDILMSGLTTFIGIQCDFISNNFTELDEDYLNDNVLNATVQHHWTVLQ